MSKRTLLWLSAILIVAGFLRFYHLTQTPPGLYPDEAMDGDNALQALHTGDFKVFYAANNGEEGLFADLEAVVLAASGVHEPWTLRLPSAVFGFFTVLGLFFLARELFRRDGIALLAAFFLATSFWHVNFSRIGFRAILAPFFLVWSVYFFTRSIRAARFVSSAWLATLGGLFFGLGAYSYISYRIAPLLFLLMVPLLWRERRFWRAGAVFATVALLIMMPIGLYFLHHPADFFGRTSQVSVLGSPHPAADVFRNSVKTAEMLDFHGDENWRHNLPGRPELSWPVGLAFWTGVILGLLLLFKKHEPRRDGLTRSRAGLPYLLCFAWIGLAGLPVVFSNEGVPHALRAILMIPPIMLLAAAGGAWIYDRAAKRLAAHGRVLTLAVGACLIALMLTEGNAYFNTWARKTETSEAFTASLTTLGYNLRSVPRSTPKYIVIDAAGGTIAQADPWDPAGRMENIPIAIQPVMFLTDTYLPQQQLEQNIHYVLIQDKASVPADALTAYVTMR